MRGFLLVATLLAATAEAAAEMDAAALRQDSAFTRARVVDARSAAESSFLPVPGSLSYHRGMRMIERRVVVIADRDNEALAAAEALEQGNPGLTAVALKGGYPALRAARPEAKLPEAGRTPTFNIPNDTCQTGEPLHTYEGDQ